LDDAAVQQGEGKVSLINNVLQARAGGAVQRCHTVRHLGSYSNAEHSWGVAMLILQLFPECPHLLKYALVHDIPEGVTGDVPAPVKKDGFSDAEFEDYILREWDLPQLSDLNAADGLVLKTCDKLELWLWTREQGMLGNCYASEVRENLEHWFVQPGYLHKRGIGFWTEALRANHVPDRVGQFAAMKEGYAKYVIDDEAGKRF
jgi:HD domain-containing protein